MQAFRLKKAERLNFLKEVAKVMQGLELGKVAVKEAYDQLVKLMGEQEMGRILQLMHQRAMTVLKDKN